MLEEMRMKNETNFSLEQETLWGKFNEEKEMEKMKTQGRLR